MTSIVQCKKCNKKYQYDLNKIEYDNSGYGYLTKLIRCPYCGKVKIIKHIEDKSLDVNNDERFYIY